jgi:uncharacterized protein
MITQYFGFLPGVGERAQARLRASGINDWQSFLAADNHPLNNAEQYKEYLKKCISALETKDSGFFQKVIPMYEHWRLFPHFREEACYLDIETTGLGRDNDHVTTVSFYDGRHAHTYIQGYNLSEESLNRELSRYKLLVTFNGICFDVPFLLTKYPGLKIGMPHIDLRFAGRKAGLKGGLKKIEKILGIGRDGAVEGVDGFEAVRMWYRWKYRNSREDLVRLIKYNQEDVIHLREIMEIVYSRLMEGQSVK